MLLRSLLNTYERSKLLKITHANTLDEIAKVAAKYEVKTAEKIQMGVKLNPDSAVAKLMRFIAQLNLLWRGLSTAIQLTLLFSCCSRRRPGHYLGLLRYTVCNLI